MSELILKFTLPEEKEESEFALRGIDWHVVCWDLDQYLRSQTKYDPGPKEGSTPEELAAHEARQNALQEIRDKLYEFLSSRSLSM
jgi:hypothetical protein